MLKIVNFGNKDYWDGIVKSFTNEDVYYLSGYVKAFKIHGDGEPVLLYFESDNNKAICVMMKRDVATDSRFNNHIPENKWFDMITPYGYGGFLFEKAPSFADITKLKEDILHNFIDEGIVSAFFRFHPILGNAHYHEEFSEVIDLGKTIAFDLTSDEIIWQNITSKNRNMIRKAEKSGVEIKHGKGMELLNRFKDIYDETMRHDNAEDYYFFNKEFYESIDKDLKDNYEIFYAEYNEKIIAMSIMIFAGNQMHYHLSGSLYEYRNLAPSNLLLYKAALWGCEKGFKTFHLGGGVGSGEDNLYKFKAAFNRNSDYQFSIGKMIINKSQYNKLVAFRGFSEEEASSISFFPKYRAIIK